MPEANLFASLSEVSEKSPAEIERWLQSPTQYHCDGCGARLVRFERMNGAGLCWSCSPPSSGERQCSCAGVPPGCGHGGWHFTNEGAVYERCPAYCHAMGMEVVGHREERYGNGKPMRISVAKVGALQRGRR